MAKEKLTTPQNLALRGLSLAQKLKHLSLWRKSGEITQEQFNYFSNLWISRETKKKLKAQKTPTPQKPMHKNRHRTVVEGAMECFLNRLQGKLNNYLAQRLPAPLSNAELSLFHKYLSECLMHRGLINKLLVVGLRYPDKRLNRICEKFIRENKKYPHYSDIYFWNLLWEDGNLVPMDAIRLMLVKKEDRIVIDPVFEKDLIKFLLPLIELQRDKEKTRLDWVSSLEGEEKEKEVKRKEKRLKAFERLLQAAHEYIL